MKYRLPVLLIAAILFSVTSNAQSSQLGLNTIVIDPGHGGTDPGCISKDGKTQEKKIVLDISTRLSNKIKEAYPDVKVLMTRDDDKFIPLNNRASYASRNNASFFLSIHINASDRSTSPNGYSVHLLGQSENKNSNTYAYNMDVCKRENEVILLEEDYSTTYQGFDPKDPESDIFLKLMHNAYREQSLLFAQIIDNKLKKGPFRTSNGIHQNNFAVLRQASMPAMLLELGFMTNPSDLTILRNTKEIDKIVDLLFESFKEYKTLYDESLGAGKPAEQKLHESPKIQMDSISYGVQILVSSQDKADNDKFFLGYTPLRLEAGRYIKFIIAVSPDKAATQAELSKIRKTYKDAFLVKIEGGTAKAEK